MASQGDEKKFNFQVLCRNEEDYKLLLYVFKNNIKEFSSRVLNGNGTIVEIYLYKSLKIRVVVQSKWHLIEIMKMMDGGFIRRKLQRWIGNIEDLSKISIDVQIDSGERRRMQQYVIPRNFEVISSISHNFYMSSVSQYIPQGRPLNILLLGKTGAGKSYLGNTILNKQNLFSVYSGAASGTQNVEKQCGLVKGRKLTVVDTPGFMNTIYDTNAIHEICATLANCPDGFDAIILVQRYGSRVTNEEREAAYYFHSLFGEQVEKYSFIVFTHGYQYRGDMDDKDKPYDFKSFIRQHEISSQEDSFGSLLRKFPNGWIFVENREKDPLRRVRQVNELIGIVDNIRSKNNYKKYTNELFEAAREKRRKLQRQNVEKETCSQQ